MVPENEFHYKEPVNSANPGGLQNGPGNSGKPAATAASATSKSEEGTAEDAGECTVEEETRSRKIEFPL